ncbi:hypothetical protein ACWGJX_29035, partial [Streptomyces sp. NPDC054775]
KLWELRSYDQVIKLEQERLVYQARLRSRFGRTWRRKAPVESLMPLRLAKYGVPLMDTAPAGLAAAGIKPASVPDTASPVRAPAPTQRRGREATGTGSPQAAVQPRSEDLRPTSVLSPAPDRPSSPRRADEEGTEEFTDGYLAHARSHPDQLDLAGPAHEQDRTLAAGAPPAAGKDHEPLLAYATREKRPPHVKATINGLAPHTSAEEGRLTLVDRYYFAWQEYRTQHGDEPTGQKLSAYLADKGLHNRSGKPVSPSTLRRYFLSFRLYTIWAEHRESSSTPALDAIAHDCAAHGITAQYNKPLTIHNISEHADDFERRWQATTQHHADPQRPHVDG